MKKVKRNRLLIITLLISFIVFDLIILAVFSCSKDAPKSLAKSFAIDDFKVQLGEITPENYCQKYISPDQEAQNECLIYANFGTAMKEYLVSFSFKVKKVVLEKTENKGLENEVRTYQVTSDAKATFSGQIPNLDDTYINSIIVYKKDKNWYIRLQFE